MLAVWILTGRVMALTDDVTFSKTLKDLDELTLPETTVLAEAGATSSYGNSLATVVYADIDAAYRWGWRSISLDGMTEQGRAVIDVDGDGTLQECERELGYQSTAEKFSFDLRSDRYLDTRNAIYGLSGWLRDPFSGYESRVHGQSGFSRLLMDDETHILFGELGIDLARERYSAGVDPSRSWLYSARGEIDWLATISPDLQISETLEAFMNVRDPTDIRILSEASVLVTATDILSVKMSYQVAHDTVPVEGYRKTDQTLGFTLVASFSHEGGVPEIEEPFFEDDPS